LEGNGSQFEELDKEDWVEEVDMCPIITITTLTIAA
jgi:hypothetical protein